MLWRVRPAVWTNGAGGTPDAECRRFFWRGAFSEARKSGGFREN